MFRKEKFPLTVFVAASFLALIMFLLLLVLTSLNLKSFSGAPSRSAEKNKPSGQTKYYLKDDFNKDPLVTKVPNWNNLLAGPIISPADPAIGAPEAKVNIVAFSDFICDYCADQEEIYRRIIEDYQGKIKFIWKDYPENDFNSVSFRSALAARCAQAQDKFWPYHDLLFQNNKNLSEDKYYDLADEAGLGAGAFKNCLADKKTFNLVADNMKEAEALEITGIPFVYVNDQEVMGKTSYENLKKIIDIQLEKTEPHDE